MMEQLNLFDQIQTNPIPKEQWVYKLLLPDLKERLAKDNADPNCLHMEKGKDYYSVQYIKIDPFDSTESISKLVFRIRLLKKGSYFEVSDIYLGCAPEELLAESEPFSKQFTRFPFELTEAGVKKYAQFLADLLEEVTYSFPNDFDCCSRAEQCSNARHCIHPNSALALGCGYRKVLRSGRIFYGKNRNIDGKLVSDSDTRKTDPEAT